MRVRSCRFALAFVSAGAILFGAVCLGAIVFLADAHCGAAFGYYGCETLVAAANKEDDQVGLRQGS
jgi:hypothetical protein